MAMAVFEILQSMRETAKREAEKVKRKAEEQEKNGGLSKKERIELEAKKEEIKRLETIAEQTANRQIGELVRTWCFVDRSGSCRDLNVSSLVFTALLQLSTTLSRH